MAHEISFPWDTFLQLQALTNTHVISARTHACEEALDELLEELTVGAGPADAHAMRKRYHALATNRMKKYRHRHALADQVAHHQQSERRDHNHPDLVADRELAALAVAQLPPQDRELLHDVVSNGTPYREAASRLRKPVGTLKARVSRLRRRLREGHAGRTIWLPQAAA